MGGLAPRKKGRSAVLGGGALLMALAALLVLVTRGADEKAPVASRPPLEGGTPTAADGVDSELALAPSGSGDLSIEALARGPLPASLEGTDPDGGLMLDDAGRFVPTTDALALFNYYLAASGEEPLAVIRQRIIDRIHELLPPEAAAEAEALLDRYLDYRTALRELAEARDVPGDLERRLQWLRELRREHFGALATDLFAEAEQTTRIDLERRRVALDPELDEAERRSELEALEAQLPERVREARARANAPARARAEVTRVREDGGSAEEVFAVRERHFGTEAAQRLAVMDAEHSEWQTRLDAYQQERDALRAQHADDSGALEAEVSALRSEHFSDVEQARVRALDGLAP